MGAVTEGRDRRRGRRARGRGWRPAAGAEGSGAAARHARVRSRQGRTGKFEGPVRNNGLDPSGLV